MQARHCASWFCSVVGPVSWCSLSLAAGVLPQEQADMGSLNALMQTANETNKNLPMMVDKETELFSTNAQPGMFVYNYRLVGVVLTPGNSERAEGLLKTVRPSIVNAACTTPEVRDGFLVHGVALRYTYYDRDKKFIVALEVGPDDCKRGK